MFHFLRRITGKSRAPKPAKRPLTVPFPRGIALNFASSAKMLSKLIGWGLDNQISIGEGSMVKGSIRIRGAGNKIEIGTNVFLNSHIVIQGSRNRISLRDNVVSGGRIVIKGKDQSVEIGEGTVAKDTYILCQEGQYVKIGRGCLFSRKVEIRTTDAHALVSRETGERLNKPRPIEIGDHVWIGLDVLVSKGAKIAEDNIIGAKSFISKHFDESGTVIAGVPAKVVKRGVTWQRDTKATYQIDDLDNWRASSDSESKEKCSGH